MYGDYRENLHVNHFWELKGLTLYTLRHWKSYSLQCSLYISHNTEEENLFENQEIPILVIVPLLSGPIHLIEGC